MDTDSEWKNCKNQSDVEKLLELACDFHDCISIEGRWDGADFVDSERRLVYGGWGALLLQIDSQFADVPRIELRFNDVRRYRYDCESEHDGEIGFHKDLVIARLIEWEVTAGSLEYRSLPE